MGDSVPRQGAKPVVHGRRAMVSSSHPAVTEVMVDVLRDGGNAVDAAVAGSLVQPVYEPHMTNHAGTVAFLYWGAGEGRGYFMDACAELPGGLRPFHPNSHAAASAACIPGFMPGLAAMLERFGSKTWRELAEPAVRAAREGITITPWQYGYFHASLAYRTYFPSGRAFFTPDGFLVPAGERWSEPGLARTLEKLRDEGPEYFSTGGWAKRLVEEGERLGWGITLEHLATYEPAWYDPLSFNYRDDEVMGMPPPQRGALYAGLIMGVLEEFDLRGMGHYTESAESLALIAWAMARAHAEKGLMHDPKFYEVPVDVLLSKEYHKMIAESYKRSRPRIDLSPWMRLNLGEAALHAGLPASGRSPHDSCELSIVDGEGNWVEMMNTGNGGGIPGMVIDGVVCGGTSITTSGVTGTGRFETVVEPGARTRHAIASTFVLRDGEPWLAVGSPGDCIFTVPITLLNVLEYGMEPHAAVDAPRFWPLGEDGSLEVEARIPERVVEGLLRLGIAVRPAGTYDWRMGSMQLVWRDKETGELGGVADPRRLGAASGL
ncbi:MAG: gamma-glutamyltransferase [Candidatus Bathyarchaeota archaeon]|nr:MAG: gamma-glutamyltransferase [Candidatus Bathyarchaeota archaeon]